VRYQLKKLYHLGVLTLFLFFGFALLSAKDSFAATIRWDGGAGLGDPYWSSCTNWVGDVCPIATDTVVFDGTYTGDSSLDRGFGGSIAAININTGYTGTITVYGPLTVGTFNQSAVGSTFTPNLSFTGDEDFIFTGNFNQSAGTFNDSSTVNYFRGNVTLSNVANFIADRDLVFDGAGSSTFTCQDKPTYSITNVQILKTGNEANVTIGDGCIIPVGVDPVLQVGNNGGLTVYGNLTGIGTLSVKGYRNGNFSNANVTLACGTGLSPNCLSGFSGFDLASANSEAITGRTLTISELDTVFDANDFSPFNLSINNVTVSNSATFVAPTGMVAFPGDLTLINSAVYTPPSGSYTVNGILTLGITLNASAITSVGGLVINSGGVFQAPAGIINNAGDFTLNAGGTYTHNSGTMNFNASSSARTITCSGAPFNLVTINMRTRLTIGSGCTVSVGNNPIVQLFSTEYLLVNGTLSGTGVLYMKGYTGTATYRSPAVTLSCGSSSCLSGFSGFDMKTNNTTWGASHLTVSGAGTTLDASGFSVLDLDGGSFLLSSSASFTAPSGIMNVGEDINIASGTTFNHNSGTVNLTSANTNAAGITCTGNLFNLVTINKTSASVTIFAGCTVPVGNNPIVQVNHSSGFFINGTLSGSGILYLKGYGNGIAYYSPRFTISCGTSSCLSGFSGIDMETENNTLFSNAFTITGAGTSLDASTYSVLNTGSASFILSTSAAFIAPATNFRIGWNFTINTGTTFNHNNGIITFARSSGSQALNCGTVTLYDVVVAGSGSITLQTTDCTINDLTITSGTFSSPSDARILNVLGDLNHNAATNLGGGNLTINFSGTGNQYFNQTAGNIISHITVNKASGELILGNDISVTIGACTVIEGILYLNGHSYSCFAGLTIQEGGELKLQGTEVVSSPTLLSGSAVTFVGDGDPLSETLYPIPDWNYLNARINISPTDGSTFFLNTNESVAELFLYSGTLETTGATTFTPTDVWMEGGTWIPFGLSINVSNDFFCNSGTFSGSTGSLTVAGDLSIAGCNFTAVSGNTTVNGSITRSSGTFNHNNGTVVLGGTNQILDGTVTFYNLTKTVTSPDTLYFLSGSTNRILGALRLSGTDGNLLTLAPTTSSTQWYIDPEGTRDIAYASVSYSTNVDSEILDVYGGNVVDGGSNVFWLFVDDISGPTLSATNASTSWFTTQRTAVVSVSDSEAGVAEVRYSWGTNGMDASCTTGGAITSNGASLNSPIGGTTLYLCARDYVDNVSTWNGQYNWETTAPSVSASNASAVWFNAQRTAVVSATDTGGSGIAEVRYNWGSDPFDAGCTTGGTVTSHGASLNSPEGSTFLYLCTRDNAGLTATWNGEYKWEDNLPTGGSIFYVDGYYSVVMIDLTVDDGTDADSGLNISTRTVTKSSATLVNGVCGAFDGPLVIIPTGTYPNFTDSANTSGNCYRYWYLITDNAGNQQTYSSSNTYMLDTETPTLSASNSSTSWFSTQRIAVVTSIDGVSGLVGTRYSWGTNDMDGTCMSGGTVTSDGSSLNAPSGGTILYLCNRDNAGNVSNWSGVYNWESDAPVLSASNNSSTWYNVLRTAAVSVSDAGGSGLIETRYSWGTNDMDVTCASGGTVTSNGSSLNSPSGGTTLYLCARDGAGNVSTWNGVYNWENIVPTVSASNSSGLWFNYQRVAVVSATDTGGSGIYEIRYSWGTNDMNSFCNTGGTVVANGGSLNSPAGGTILYLCTRDTSGNTGTWSGVYNWENTAPALSASNNSLTWYNIQRTAVISVSDTGGSGLIETRYSWGTNVLNSTCTSGGTIISNGASLDSPVGGTTLYLCTRDGAGNVALWNGAYNWEITAPSGGSINYANDYSTVSNISITVNDGTDTQSGINTSSRLIERQEADLVGDTCGIFGTFASISYTGTYPNFVDSSVQTSKCYRYRYLVSDNATNQAIYASANIIKVDMTFPVSGSITYTDGIYEVLSVNIVVNTGTDVDTGIDMTSQRVERNSASLIAGVCSSFGDYGLVSLSGAYPNYSDEAVQSGYCYMYRYLISDLAGNQRVYITASIAKIKLPDIPVIPPEEEEDDETAPNGSLLINFGAAYTNDPNVTLKIVALDDIDLTEDLWIMVSNSEDFIDAEYEEYVSFKSWNLTSGDGEKIVYLKIKDSSGNESEVYSATIILDTSNPVLENIIVLSDQIIADPIDSSGVVEKVVFTVNGENICTILIPNIDGEFICSWTNPEDGNLYIIEATAYDLAGNYVMTSVEIQKLGTPITIIEIMENLGIKTTGVVEVTKAVEEVGETIVEQPVIVVGTAVSGAVVTYVSLVLANVASVNIFTTIFSWVLSISGFLGFRKKGKPYGYVFNSLTNEPISQAIVRIYSDSGDLVRTEVTDAYGVFSTYLESGTYSLTVNKARFTYPSKVLKNKSARFENLYSGGNIEVKKDSEITVAIPVDPISSRMNFILRTLVINRLYGAFDILRSTIFTVGIIVSACAFIYSQTPLNTAILIIYGISLFTLIITPKKKIKYGRVINVKKEPQSKMEINLIEEEYQRSVARRVTDDDGIYRFVVEPKNYELSLGSPNYKISNGEIKLQKPSGNSKEPMIVAQDLTISER